MKRSMTIVAVLAITAASVWAVGNRVCMMDRDHVVAVKWASMSIPIPPVFAGTVALALRACAGRAPVAS